MEPKLLDKMTKYLPGCNLDAVSACVDRLYSELPDKKHLNKNVVMVAYGGGKDSSYTAAFMRAVHLLMAERFNGDTFKLRLVTMRHSGMPYVVMQNIDRAYRALEVYDDPNTELLMLERSDVRPFDLNASMPYQVLSFNRIDLLMSGHRSYGDGRTSFCNSCNLNVADSFGIAASYDGGVDLIVTGDSPQEQVEYGRWIRKLAFKSNHKLSRGKGFASTLSTLDGLAKTYAKEIHGETHADRVAERGVTSDVPEQLSFFSIYDFTDYASGAHWQLLTEFLGFVFDDIAFSFTESDCANPALMAHFRGLRTEYVYRRSYREGVDQYVTFAIELMERKEFPESLIAIMKKRYESEEGISKMRDAASNYAKITFGLTEEQLVCMVYSPFAGQGKELHDYLSNEKPELLEYEQELHSLLDGNQITDLALSKRLEKISGLSITDLRQLYRSSLWSPVKAQGDDTDLLHLITVSDSNQKLLYSSVGQSGEQVFDRVSGR
ncbi:MULTISPECIES: hypothetical protein [unclassified Pseudoalteromonas]|uniref:hypothetical protein n=1 Tax=unclassified Pseudoalteromonas TaxID=194690 RepID=UPI002096DE76|nr:hypothetical protein [Pseudoalteromonas sp. XMcav2-N]MCO7188410.1 hypothetical protein [Pseudoalteromonas sp. XMcav2-N]